MEVFYLGIGQKTANPAMQTNMDQKIGCSYRHRIKIIILSHILDIWDVQTSVDISVDWRVAKLVLNAIVNVPGASHPQLIGRDFIPPQAGRKA